MASLSTLTGLGPVCCDNLSNKAHSRIPTPMLFSNIPLLREILDLIVQDWKREVTPLQTAISESSDESEKVLHTSKAFIDLQPHYLKCLFSYSMFFVAIEGAYDRFYEELGTLNKQPFLRATHGRKPMYTPYIKKVRLIRNISIAHIGSKKAKAANSAAAMMWQPMTLSKDISGAWDLEKMAFGTFKLTFRDSVGKTIDQSDDFEIRGLSELDGECRKYLDEYDRVCADYLEKIQAKLPVTVGNKRYYEFKTAPSSP